MSQTKQRTFDLEGFKKEFETQAKRRCEAQETTIKELHQKVSDQKEEIQVMRDRCFVLSNGALCANCEYKLACSNYKWE